MKKKFLLFYTVLASLILLASAVYFIFSLCSEYSKGADRTSANFNSIIYTLQHSDNTDLSSKSFASSLEDSIGDLNGFAYLNIDYNDIQIFSYPSEAVSPQETALTKKYEATVSKPQGDFVITAVLYLLKPSSIAFYARNAFFAVLIITLITLIVIISSNSKTDDSLAKTNNHQDDEEPLAEKNIFEKEKTSSEQKKSDGEKTSNQEETQTDIKQNSSESEKTESEETENSDEENTSRKEENPEVFELAKMPEEKNQQEQNEDKEENADSKPSEKVTLPNEEEKPEKLNPDKTDDELYSPSTGLGWEEYLAQRMDKEIDRAISSEIDLAVFVFKIPLLPRNSKEIKNISNYLTLQFQFRDLLFEYKNDSLVALKIGLSLDSALDFAEKLYSDISNILQDTEAKCFIGISTRSIRIVSGERILQEATEASIHAQEENDSPIIAFRVDTEKYRKYLEQQNEKNAD